MGFLKTVLIILLVYYLLKILARWFAPKLFSFAAKKTEQHFRERFGDFTNQNTEKEEQEGDVIVDKKPNQQTKPLKDVGDYINFEEIE